MQETTARLFRTSLQLFDGAFSPAGAFRSGLCALSVGCWNGRALLLSKQGKNNIVARMKIQQAMSLAASLAALGLQEIHGSFVQIYEFANQLKHSHFVGWTSCDSHQSFDIDAPTISVGLNADEQSGYGSDDSNGSISSCSSSSASCCSSGGATSSDSPDASFKDEHHLSENDCKPSSREHKQCVFSCIEQNSKDQSPKAGCMNALRRRYVSPFAVCSHESLVPGRVIESKVVD